MVNVATVILVSQMSAVAYYSILVWDWIISLSAEYQLIWKTDWTVYKVLYVINRYGALLALAFSLWAYTATIDGATCGKVVNLVPAACAIIILSTECILAFRTYAIWQKAKWTLFIILPLLAGEVVVMILGSISVASVVPPGVKGPCLPLAKGNAQGPTFAYWLTPFVVDCTFTIMSIYKAIQLSKFGQASNIISVFVKEGLFFFVIVSIANLLEMAFYLQPVVEMQGVCAFLALALSSLMCCRMVLSLRAFQVKNGYGGSTSGRSGQLTLEGTELSDRHIKSNNGASTPAPGGMFKLPLGGILNKNGRKHKNGDHVKSTDNALDGVVVSVDRLEKTDGQMDSNASGRRNKNGVAADPEKGLVDGIARPASLYSQGDKSDVSGYELDPSKRV